MMKECYPGADTEKLERHIFRMYDSNKVGTNTTSINAMDTLKHCDNSLLISVDVGTQIVPAHKTLNRTNQLYRDKSKEH